MSKLYTGLGLLLLAIAVYKENGLALIGSWLAFSTAFNAIGHDELKAEIRAIRGDLELIRNDTINIRRTLDDFVEDVSEDWD